MYNAHTKMCVQKSFSDFEHAMSAVTTAVNCIWYKATCHRQIQNFLHTGAERGETVHYSEGWWPIHSKMLEHRFSLRQEVQDFMQ
jgi:hypothetical protein